MANSAVAAEPVYIHFFLAVLTTLAVCEGELG